MRYALRYHAADLKLPEQGGFVIGRDPACDLCLDDGMASRQHARLNITAAGLEVDDLGSKNGTFVNGRRVEARHRFVPGDWLRVGRSELGLRVVPRQAPQSLQATGSFRTMELPILPAGAAVHEFDAPPPTRSDLQRPDLAALVRDSGRRWLEDQALPPLDRFGSALHLVELLCDAGALDEAGLLLREAIDLLGNQGTSGTLPPSAAARARGLVGRLTQTADDAHRWLPRLEVIRRAEGLMAPR